MVAWAISADQPLAHGIMEQLAIANGLDWTMTSAGTGNCILARGPDRAQTRTAREHGYRYQQTNLRQFRISDFDDYDVIYVMDKNNLADVLSLCAE